MSADVDYAAQVETEFLEEAQDTLANFQIVAGNLRSNAARRDEALGEIRRECKKLRKLGVWSDQPLIDLALLRMSNYINGLTALLPGNFDDIDTFVDVLRGILDGDIPANTNEAEFVRSLPVLRPAEIEDLIHLDIEILLVDPNRTSSRYFERELSSGGYRVTVSHRSFEALELAVRTKPELVITTAVLDELSGLDLARALHAIPSTQDIPTAILTSFAKGDPFLARLPEHVAVIRKGKDFGDDLARTLERYHIT